MEKVFRNAAQGNMRSVRAARRIVVVAVLVFAAALLSGCALTQDTVRLQYTPQIGAPKVAGADAIGVNVKVSDQLLPRTLGKEQNAQVVKVGRKKNGYGGEMAAIVAGDDVASIVCSAIKSELANRGFSVNDGPVPVNVDINRFNNEFEVGFWAGDAVAEVAMNVQVKKPDGSIVYSKVVTGNGIEPNIQVTSGTNAENALNAALKDGVAKLMNDPEFMDALAKANAK